MGWPLTLPTRPATRSTGRLGPVTIRGDSSDSSSRASAFGRGGGCRVWATATPGTTPGISNPRTATRTAAAPRWSRRVTREASRPGSSSRVREYRGGALHETALIGVGQPRRQVSQRYPGHLCDLIIGIGQLAADRAQQEGGHRLVDAAVFSDEPVVDAAPCGHHGAIAPGLLRHLTHRSLLHCLALLDLTPGE